MQRPSWGTRIAQVLTLSGLSVVSVIGAICWLLGRAYASYWTMAAGIPSWMITYQATDYIEMGFVQLMEPLVLTWLTLTAVVLVPWFILQVFSWLITSVWSQHIHPRFESWRTKLPKQEPGPVWLTYLEAWLDQAIAVFGVVGLVVLIGLSAVFYLADRAGKQGLEGGRKSVNTESRVVQLVLEQPLALPGAITGEDGQTVYRLRLWGLQADRYYVFEDIDPATCRPREVYMIPESQVLGATIIETDLPPPSACSETEWSQAPLPVP